jgi:hypothetical protein
MRLITQTSNQVPNIFGGGYVLEQHRDQALGHFSASEVEEVLGSLTASMFSEMLKALRSALSLHA